MSVVNSKTFRYFMKLVSSILCLLRSSLSLFPFLPSPLSLYRSFSLPLFPFCSCRLHYYMYWYEYLIKKKKIPYHRYSFNFILFRVYSRLYAQPYQKHTNKYIVGRCVYLSSWMYSVHAVCYTPYHFLDFFFYDIFFLLGFWFCYFQTRYSITKCVYSPFSGSSVCQMLVCH